MRTTLDIDEDVLQAAKELAKREKRTAGKMISELARRALSGAPIGRRSKKREECFGFRPFPSRGGVVTNEAVDRLREDDAY